MEWKSDKKYSSVGASQSLFNDNNMSGQGDPLGVVQEIEIWP